MIQYSVKALAHTFAPVKEETGYANRCFISHSPKFGFFELPTVTNYSSSVNIVDITTASGLVSAIM